MIDLGPCVLHCIHNAFGTGLESCRLSVEEFVIDVSSIFKHSAARREDLEDLMSDMKLQVLHFEEHSNVRWLSLGPAVRHLIVN